MTIKSIICLIGVMLISILKSNAQKCAVVDKLDKFTNAQIIETDEVKVYGAPLDVNNQGFFLSFQLKNDTIFACLNSSGRFTNPNIFESVMLKFSDNSILTLSHFVSTGTFEQGDFSFEKSYSMIDKTILTKFVNLKMTTIRFVTANRFRAAGASSNPLINASNQRAAGGDALDNDLGSGKATKVMKQAGCMLSYIH